MPPVTGATLVIAVASHLYFLHGPHRKHGLDNFTVIVLVRWLSMVLILLRIFETVTYQWLLSRCLFRGRRPATGVYVTVMT
jgi:hypothetical protein